jgi:hemoglobin/transferrin/lactoferrin receptor protein
VIDHALTVGADGARDHVTTSDQAGGFVSALTPSGDRTLLGAFIQEEARYGGWLRVNGAVRFDKYDLSGGPFQSGGNHVSPKLTVGVTVLPGVEFYGTYADGYRAPSVTETLISGTHPFPSFNILPNPALRPEIAHNLEAGANLKFDNVLRGGDSVRAKASAFVNRIDDYIDFQSVGAPYLVPFIPGAPVSLCTTNPELCFPINSFQYLNVSKARIAGVEFEGTYDWGGGYLSLTGTHLDGKNETTGGPLSTVAPNRLSSTLGLRFLDGALNLGGRVTFVSASPASVPTSSKSYELADLFASYKYNDKVSGTLTVTNLFNKQYTQFLNASPSAGLTVKFGLTMKLASK